MEIILLESFDKLGKIGDVVKVKDGFARNYLLPKKKALRANKTNKEYYEKIKKNLEENNKKLVKDANLLSDELNKIEMIFLRQASEAGQLYGSVTPKDISNFLNEKNVNVSPSNINLTTSIKNVGIFEVIIKLHADVIVNAKINVAISEEKALEQKREILEKEALLKKVDPVDQSTDDLKSSEKNVDTELEKKEAKTSDKSGNKVKVEGNEKKQAEVEVSEKKTEKENEIN